MHKFFRYPKFSETLKGCPRNFLALWDQKFWTEKRDTPLFMHKTFRNQIISQKPYDSLTRFFGIVRQNFRLKIVILPPPFPPPPPLIHNFLRYQIFSDTQIRKVPLRNFSALRQKNFDTKSWDKSLKHKIFRYPKLVTHWRFPLRNLSALWDRHFLTENRDTPSSPPPSYP